MASALNTRPGFAPASTAIKPQGEQKTGPANNVGPIPLPAREGYTASSSKNATTQDFTEGGRFAHFGGKPVESSHDESGPAGFHESAHTDEDPIYNPAVDRAERAKLEKTGSQGLQKPPGEVRDYLVALAHAARPSLWRVGWSEELGEFIQKSNLAIAEFVKRQPHMQSETEYWSVPIDELVLCFDHVSDVLHNKASTAKELTAVKNAINAVDELFDFKGFAVSDVLASRIKVALYIAFAKAGVAMPKVCSDLERTFRHSSGDKLKNDDIFLAKFVRELDLNDERMQEDGIRKLNELEVQMSSDLVKGGMGPLLPGIEKEFSTALDSRRTRQDDPGDMASLGLEGNDVLTELNSRKLYKRQGLATIGEKGWTALGHIVWCRKVRGSWRLIVNCNTAETPLYEMKSGDDFGGNLDGTLVSHDGPDLRRKSQIRIEEVTHMVALEKTPGAKRRPDTYFLARLTPSDGDTATSDTMWFTASELKTVLGSRRTEKHRNECEAEQRDMKRACSDAKKHGACFGLNGTSRYLTAEDVGTHPWLFRDEQHREDTLEPASNSSMDTTL